jgi:hypothetical protein
MTATGHFEVTKLITTLCMLFHDFKGAKMTYWYLLGVGLAIANHAMAVESMDMEVEGRVAIAKMSAVRHLNELMNESDGKKLVTLSLKLRKLSDATKKEILVLLIEKLDSLTIIKDVRVVDAHRQDITFEGGRAAMLIEVLLDCDLPKFEQKFTQVEQKMLITESIARIVRCMSFDNTSAAYSKDLPLVERISIGKKATNVKLLAAMAEDSDKGIRSAVAANVRTAGFTLEKLSRDTSVEVRRIVAANRGTPLETLDILLKDADEQVRLAADENRLRARSLETE